MDNLLVIILQKVLHSFKVSTAIRFLNLLVVFLLEVSLTDTDNKYKERFKTAVSQKSPYGTQ